jgi:hypothetical protein
MSAGEKQKAHGPALEGDGEAPPLSGGELFWAWNGKPLTAQFHKIYKEMPHNKPGTLSPDASADLLAYVLQFDKFPAVLMNFRMTLRR